MKDGASEAEQNQLQPSPKRQGLATYVRVLRSSRFLRTISVFVFWNRLVLCLSSRKFRTLPRSPVSRLQLAWLHLDLEQRRFKKSRGSHPSRSFSSCPQRHSPGPTAFPRTRKPRGAAHLPRPVDRALWWMWKWKRE
jgi:hypothetical protein